MNRKLEPQSNQLNIYLPRFKVDLNEVRELMGKNIALGYKSVYKLGLDEDATTLAVNCFFELEESLNSIPNKIVLGVGETTFDLNAFKQGTDLKEVIFVKKGEVTGIITLGIAIKEKLPFIVVDSVSSENNVENSYLSACAVSGFLDLKIDMTEYPGTPFTAPRNVNSNFISYEDKLLLQNSSKIVPDLPLIFPLSNLQLSGKMKNLFNRGQINYGYSGIATTFLELFFWLRDSKEDKIQIIVSDIEKSLSAIVHRSDADLKISKSRIDLTGEFLLKNIMQISKELKAPVAQGAFISNSNYLAEAKSRYRLQTVRCEPCDKSIFPPRILCKNCNTETTSGIRLSRFGTVYSVTKISKGGAPTEFDNQQEIEGEYLIVLVEFQEGPRVIAQMTDSDLNAVKINQKVKMVFRKYYSQDNLIRYGFKFVKF